MKKNIKNNFITVKKEVKQIFDKYRVFKFKIEQQKKFNFITISKNDFEKYESYVNMIDCILDWLNTENKKILKKFFIDNCPKEQFNFCDSTFYMKLKCAIKEFLSLYK